MKSKLLLYNIKPFNRNIVFYFSDREYDILNELGKKVNESIKNYLYKDNDDFDSELDNDSTCHGVVKIDKKDYPRFMWIKKEKDKEEQELNLIHEISHLLDYLQDFFSFQEETEFRAYLNENIFRELKEIINE